MSRPPRIISKTGLYHIVFRGINKQDLFEEKADYDKLIDILVTLKKDFHFEVYAYCFMTNHAHLFIKEQESEDIKKIMHRLLTRYVGWYNFKYKRSGSLIGNRYKSEPIEDAEYYLTLLRYIHQNPIKAGIVKKISEYRYSSYNDYIKLKTELVDIRFALSMFDTDNTMAVQKFEEYHSYIGDDNFYISNTKKLTDEQLRRKLKRITKGVNSREISELPRQQRNELLNQLREAGFTIGQLERLTGVSRGIITRAKDAQKQARP